MEIMNSRDRKGSIEIKKVGRIRSGRQDGAVWKGLLFSFDHRGNCCVYDMKRVGNGEEWEAVDEFRLDRADEIAPHSNAVVFGSEYYDSFDEFPLLYTNVYNNYAKEEMPRKGTCLVYRLQRIEGHFVSTLVQMIEVGFTEEVGEWRSYVDQEDVRPYGNFAIDADRGLLYAFTMHDGSHTTRYFAFELPKHSEGECCLGEPVRKVVLKRSDVRACFEGAYQHYMQGACIHEGMLYALEGFTEDPVNPPVMNILDLAAQKEVARIAFGDYGLRIEPEMVTFDNDCCYYGDHEGNLYCIQEGEN